MPNLISGPYRFIESGDGPVHLEFFSSPGWTLCGFEFAQDGSAVAVPGRIRFGRAPYRETARRVVNCPGCVETFASAKPSRSRICPSCSSRNDHGLNRSNFARDLCTENSNRNQPPPAALRRPATPSWLI